ncbi:MAG: UDP-N-acetylglucosamine--N-acetylmuramyl-(pentapeptide) pyrophosphoryl-undecaprenol N-acetylglucosamine transferase [Oscillospiraceae bacterium]|nr:UDP-N-acetylglucosamine--N-acetylmuramyl-(pentapeptide) pyrophosphoryl-undecaprenol N-acetylglucosamine transferase [Oscillospiraceae bacterium]
MTYLIVCGGSAGHINPAIAIAEEIKAEQPESKILFAGSDKKLEKQLIPDAGFELTNIKMTGLRRGISPRDISFNLKTVKNLLVAFSKAKKLLKEYNPDAVIGTGGSICYPIIKQASKRKIPSFLLEPNVLPGLAVRMLSKTADKIFVSYKETEACYKKPERVVYTGTPLKSDFFTAAEKEKDTQEAPDKDRTPLVISYWGSMGATGMNKKIADFILLNIKQKKFNHIHAAGADGNINKIKEHLIKSGISDAEIKAPVSDIRDYIYDMPEVMKKADLILTRAGASTIGELAAMGKPAILIPSPNVTENHQEANAKKLQEKGAAVMILENTCTGESLFEKTVSVLGDKTGLERMIQAQKSLAVKNAASVIAETVFNSIKA